MRKPTLVDEAHSWWKLWSIRLNAIGSTILVAMMSFPQVGLAIWNSMPVEVKGLLGPRATLVVPLAFFLASMGARFVKQHKVTGNGDQ